MIDQPVNDHVDGAICSTANMTDELSGSQIASVIHDITVLL